MYEAFSYWTTRQSWLKTVRGGVYHSFSFSFFFRKKRKTKESKKERSRERECVRAMDIICDTPAWVEAKKKNDTELKHGMQRTKHPRHYHQLISYATPSRVCLQSIASPAEKKGAIEAIQRLECMLGHACIYADDKKNKVGLWHASVGLRWGGKTES